MMIRMKLITIFLLILPSLLAEEIPSYNFETRYFQTALDHFSFTTNLTFPLRYLVNDTFYAENGPIFFYTGNEGDINMFAQNTGIMFDLAPHFKALIVFAEHRYYGESLPFGNLSYSSLKYLGYLSATQAIADFVYLIDDLQKTYANTEVLEKVPVIAFGGSYGGELAAWQKMKYPNSVVGAIASSAPIWAFNNLNPCDSFYKTITNDFLILGSKNCVNTINSSWAIIRSIQNQTARSELSKLWNFCSDFETNDDINSLLDWLGNIYATLAETNYPYPASFVVPLPGNPIKEFCSKIDAHKYSDDIGLLTALGEALQIYTNYTGKTECNSLSSTSDNQINGDGWYFQCCTELNMILCSKDTDMFENYETHYEDIVQDCNQKFGVHPWSPNVAIMQYGGKDLSAAHNIIFTNGLLDPWSGYGVLTNYSSDVIAVVIKDGVHHSDLRASNENDPESVVEARRIIKDSISKWLSDYYSANNMSWPESH